MTLGREAAFGAVDTLIDVIAREDHADSNDLAGKVVAVGAILVGFGLKNALHFFGGVFLWTSAPVAGEGGEVHDDGAFLDLRGGGEEEDAAVADGNERVENEEAFHFS